MSGNNKYCVSICQCQRPHPPDPHSHPHSHHPTCQRILPLNQPQINKHGRVQLYRNSTLGWIISFQYSTTKTRDQFLHVYRFGGATNRTGMNFHELSTLSKKALCLFKDVVPWQLSSDKAAAVVRHQHAAIAFHGGVATRPKRSRRKGWNMRWLLPDVFWYTF